MLGREADGAFEGSENGDEVGVALGRRRRPMARAEDSTAAREMVRAVVRVADFSGKERSSAVGSGLVGGITSESHVTPFINL